MNTFIKSNPNLCIGCRTCMIACVVAHEGKEIFEVDPDSYDFNPRLTLTKTAKITSTIQCHHCENAPCVQVCPVGALFHDTDRIGLNQEKCIGCHQCNQACPFGAIRMVTIHEGAAKLPRNVAHKCDLCTGLGHGPACASVCPTGALTVVTEERFRNAMIAKRDRAAAVVALACQKEGM